MVKVKIESFEYGESHVLDDYYLSRVPNVYESVYLGYEYMVTKVMHYSIFTEDEVVAYIEVKRV